MQCLNLHVCKLCAPWSVNGTHQAKLYCPQVDTFRGTTARLRPSFSRLSRHSWVLSCIICWPSTPNFTQTEQQILAALTELFLTIAVATVTTLALVRELTLQISYAEFNEKPANGLVTDVRSPTGGRTRSAHTASFCTSYRTPSNH
jgi:hypothetical protein